MYFNKNNNLDRGFTLLEMIVSLGIFTIVAVIAVGSLVRITSLNRQAQSMQASINNINYIIESISREMRFGYSYHCLQGNNFANNNGNLDFKDCNDVPGNADKAILFKSTNIDQNLCNLIYGYWFKKNNNTWSINKSQQKTCSDNVSLNDSWPMIDSNNVTVTNVDFDIIPGNEGYALLKIRLQGYSGVKENEKINFDIRTLVAQRIKYEN